MLYILRRWLVGIAVIFMSPLSYAGDALSNTKPQTSEKVANFSSQWLGLMDQIFDDPQMNSATALEIADEAAELTETINKLSLEAAGNTDNFADFCSVFRPYTQTLILISRNRLESSMLFGPDYLGRAPLEIQEYHIVAISAILDARSELALSPAGLCASGTKDTIEIDWMSSYNRLLDDMVQTLPPETVVKALNISRRITALVRSNSVPADIQKAMNVFYASRSCTPLETGKSAFLNTIQTAAEFIGENFEFSEAVAQRKVFREIGVKINFPEISPTFLRSVQNLIIECAWIENDFPKLKNLENLMITDSVLPRGFYTDGLIANTVRLRNIQLNGPFELHNSSLGSINISGISSLTKEIIPPDLRETFDEVYGEFESASLNFYNSNIRGDAHIRDLSQIKRISFRSAQLGPWTKIESVDRINDISLDRSTGRRIYIENVRGEAERNIEDTDSRIELEFSKFDEISVINAIEFDQVDLFYARYDQGFFSGLDIRENVNLLHASSLFTRFEKSIFKLIEFGMSSHETFVLRDSQVEQVNGQNSNISDILYIENIIVKNLNNESNKKNFSTEFGFESINARHITIINLCAPNANFYFGAANIGQLFEAQSMSVDRLNFSHSTGRSMVLFGEPINRIIAEPQQTKNNDAALPPEANTETPEKKFEITQAPWETCNAKNEFDSLRLNGAQFNEVRISGAINSELSMTGLRASRVLFNDQYVGFGNGAIINARDAKLQSLSIPKVGFRDEEMEPIAIDLMGSEVGILKWFEPGKDLPISQNQLPPLDTTEADCPFFDCVLRSAKLANGPDQYNPYIYNVLQTSAKSLGMTSDARRLLIAKNDDYRRSLSGGEGNFGEWLVYILGKYVNEYGYNNVRGFLWLIGIWVFGALVYSAGRWSHLGGNSTSAEAVAGHDSLDRQSPTIYAIFGSLDRTVPTLGLDTDFGTVRGLHPVQTTLIYIQRFLAFVVIAIMLGGLFDFFQ